MNNEDEMRLQQLRDAIDRIDSEWIALLARRFEMTREVGVLKARLGEPPLNPLRQEQRLQLLAGLSSRHGVSQTLIQELFASLSAEVLAAHRQALVALHGHVSAHT